MAKKSAKSPPQFVIGRKGNTSVVDCMVRALWQARDKTWPAKTFEELRTQVSELQGYHVTPSTIRSSAYQYPMLFERLRSEGGLRWRLTEQARTGKLS